MNDDERWLDWGKRFHGAYDDVTNLHLDRYLWRNIVAMLQANPDNNHHGMVTNHLARTYSTNLAVGIRRQTALDDRTASLVYVLHDIAAHGYIVTKERWLEMAETRRVEVRGGPAEHLPQAFSCLLYTSDAADE